MSDSTKVKTKAKKSIAFSAFGADDNRVTTISTECRRAQYLARKDQYYTPRLVQKAIDHEVHRSDPFAQARALTRVRNGILTEGETL